MTVQILQGDVFDVLATLPDESVHCVVTSPPYWGLRDYGVAGQIGLEPTMAEYVATMVRVFREVRRVLRTDGTVWLNLGDSYFRNPAKGGSGPNGKEQAYLGDVYGRAQGANRGQNNDIATNAGNAGRVDRGPAGSELSILERGRNDTSLKEKDLCMIPSRVALALQDDGWYLRSEIIWAKPNPMPESVTDRPTSAHEKVFLLTKSARYFYDADAVRQPMADSSIARLAQDIEHQAGSDRANGGAKTNGPMKAVGRADKQASGKAATSPRNDGNAWNENNGRGFIPTNDGANLRNVWTIATRPYSEAHFATFPPELPEMCIKAGCPVGGTVLDPFGGAGTTGLVADRLGSDAVLIELNPEYAEMARTRIVADGPLFAEVNA